MKIAAKTIIYILVFIAITLVVFLFMAKSSAGAFLTNFVITTKCYHALENSLGIIGVDGEEDLIFWSYTFLGCLVAGMVFLAVRLRLGGKRERRIG